MGKTSNTDTPRGRSVLLICNFAIMISHPYFQYQNYHLHKNMHKCNC